MTLLAQLSCKVSKCFDALNDLRGRRKRTAVDGICFLVWDLNAELLHLPSVSDLYVWSVIQRTSSIAITTSTVSKLSRPRSFEKCDEPES